MIWYSKAGQPELRLAGHSVPGWATYILGGMRGITRRVAVAHPHAEYVRGYVPRRMSDGRPEVDADCVIHSTPLHEESTPCCWKNVVGTEVGPQAAQGLSSHIGHLRGLL